MSTLQATPLASLEVVGYGDALPGELRPRLVPPLFRVRGTDRYILPPFRISPTSVISSLVATKRDLERSVAQGQASLIARPFLARPRHALLIDEDGEACYAPAAVVGDLLEQVSAQRLGEAMAELQSGKWQEAAVSARGALAANDRALLAVVVLYVLAHLRGAKAQERVFLAMGRAIAPEVNLSILAERVLQPSQLAIGQLGSVASSCKLPLPSDTSGVGASSQPSYFYSVGA